MPVPGKKHITILISVLFIIFIALGIGVQRSVLALDEFDEEFEQMKIMIRIMTLIQDDYVDPDKTKTEDLIEGAIQGMVSKLDQYSVYLAEQEAKEFNDQTKGSFGGLGIQIDIVDGWLTVIDPLPNTPAEEVGLMSGDRIVKIEGESTKNINIYEATKKLKGEPGTTVTISIAREGEKELIPKVITRAIINTNAVQDDEKKMLDDTIAYIRLRDFTSDAAEELEDAIRELQMEGMKGLVFDLRYNSGGLHDVAVDVSELFIERGKLIVFHRSRNNREKKYIAESKPLGDFLLAILVNEFSASASEIVAGCIQDHSRGIIVGPAGHRTFGKGSVQTMFELKQGSSLKLTTAKYYTPSGRSIEDEEGLLPDIQVQITDNQRAAIRKEEKMGYIPPRLLGKKEIHSSTHPITVDEVFESPNEGSNSKDEIYDLELYTAYQCLKGAEVLYSLKQGQIKVADPGN